MTFGRGTRRVWNAANFALLRILPNAEPPRGMTEGQRATRIGLLLGRAIVAVFPRAAKVFEGYRPEKHYMRGPGPKSLSMIGERFRAETEDFTQEPLPERWHELVRSLHKEEGNRPTRDDEQVVLDDRRSEV
jgi:hypothetical protein